MQSLFHFLLDKTYLQFNIRNQNYIPKFRVGDWRINNAYSNLQMIT